MTQCSFSFLMTGLFLVVSCILTACCLACAHLATSPNILAWTHCMLAIYGPLTGVPLLLAECSGLGIDKWGTVAANDYPPLLYLFSCQIVAQISAVIGWALHWYIYIYIYNSIPWSDLSLAHYSCILICTTVPGKTTL